MAWLYMTGRWPRGQVDHRDLDKGNDRWLNLRVATPGQNNANSRSRKTNTSGFKGVSYHIRVRKYVAQIGHNGKIIYLGQFDDPAIAHQAYAEAARRLYGEFARVA